MPDTLLDFNWFVAQVLLECSQQVIALGAGSIIPPQHCDGNTSTLPAVSGELPDPKSTAILSAEPPLIQLYKRAAVVEEVASRNQEHCLALDGRLGVRLSSSISLPQRIKI